MTSPPSPWWKMPANGMVRPCSCPASDESGKAVLRKFEAVTRLVLD